MAASPLAGRGGRRRRSPGPHLSWWRPDCVAGVGGFELRNVVAKYPFERSHRFPVIEPNCGRRDYSRSSCDGGRRSSGLVPGSRPDACLLAGIAATFCRCRDDPAAANPAIPWLTLRWTFPAKKASVVVTDSEPHWPPSSHPGSCRHRSTAPRRPISPSQSSLARYPTAGLSRSGA